MVKTHPLRIACLLAKIMLYSSLCIDVTANLRISEVYADPANPPPWQPWNVTGVQKLVVVCIEFNDVAHTIDASIIQTRLSNMAKYFYNVSLGRISVDITFFSDWKRLNGTMEYYGQDANGPHDAKSGEFIVDSVKAWNRFVNFSDYDCLLIIHAGEDQSSNPEFTKLLWRQNYCNLGRSSKSLWIEGEEFHFWGVAYDSEFEEWGLIAHEFGHSLGLPDLYIENKSLTFDRFSLMARGDRNGFPEGAYPAHLDGFSMCMLGWLKPTIVELNPTEDVVEMKPSGYELATLLKIPISDRQYYLVEIRENAGIDEYTVSSPSVIVYMIDEMIESKKGIATVLTGGIVAQGSTYSDVVRDVFVSFYSFDSSTHLATVGLSTKLFIVDIDIPESVESLYPVRCRVKVFESSNNPVEGAILNISVGENYQTLLVTDAGGIADFEISFGIFELGKKLIRTSSTNMLIGEKEKEILVVFPSPTFIIGLLSILLIITLFYAIKYWKNRSRAYIQDWARAGDVTSIRNLREED